MTLEEKVQFAHGIGFVRNAGFAGRVAGIPRLGIPDLVLADGPNGVGNGATGVTAFPASISTAATWDTAAVRRYGDAIGREQAGKGNNVALAPTMNIVRVPQWGRAFESFSEDPRLTADLATAEIRGIQAQGVIADAKHFAANNQETDRAFNDMAVRERVLREIYLPAFESAVKRAGVLSAMCAYNRVNGRYACQNDTLMTRLLKREWGFRGFVVSDWAATHSSARSARAGLDLEMPFGPSPDYPQFFGPSLLADVQSRRVTEARLDDMVTRTLTAMIAVGILDRGVTGDQGQTVTTPAHQRLARTLSEEGSVIPSRTTTPLDGIAARARARGIRVTYAPGTKGTPALPDIPSEQLAPGGVTATYYPSSDFSGAPVATRAEPRIGFTSPPSVPGFAENGRRAIPPPSRPPQRARTGSPWTRSASRTSTSTDGGSSTPTAATAAPSTMPSSS